METITLCQIAQQQEPKTLQTLQMKNQREAYGGKDKEEFDSQQDAPLSDLFKEQKPFVERFVLLAKALFVYGELHVNESLSAVHHLSGTSTGMHDSRRKLIEPVFKVINLTFFLRVVSTAMMIL